MDVAIVGAEMLSAAKAAAGQTWPRIQHDFASDLGIVLRNAARIEKQLNDGDLTQEEAKDLLEDQSNTLFMLTAEVEQGMKIMTQNAINAAVDILGQAVLAAIP